MKRTFCIFTAAALALLTGCGAKGGAKGGTGSPGAESFDGKREGEIVVSAYDTMGYRNFLEEAARSFEAENPGTKIKVETFSAMPEIREGGTGTNRIQSVQVQDDPQGRADYVSRVNTGLMSGTGADLYALDVLPLQRFVQNKNLENLEPWMDADPGFQRQDYRENILDALRYKNGTWFLPLEYTFKYYAYDARLVPAAVAEQFGPDKAWNSAELLALGESLYSGEYKIFNSTLQGLGLQMLNENIRKFADLENKKANFLDGGFTGMLNSLKTYAEKGYLPPDPKGQDNPEAMMEMVAMTPTDRFFFKLNENISLLTQFTRGTEMRMMMIQSGSVAGVTDDDEIAGIAALSDGAVPFSYGKAFGLSAQSKNKALAWAFLTYLLQKEAQLSTSFTSGELPLNNQARLEKAETLFSGSMRGGAGRPLSDQMRGRMERYREAVETLSDSINTLVLRDSAIDDMISAEARYFLDGSRSPEAVAKVLQNKTDLYLNE
ncbi:MAG: extracellular solute-binding protein [Treponema sp.]|nr:extracellular solute-binding protein [Treponema sp.]